MVNNPFGFTVEDLISRESGEALRQARNAARAVKAPRPKPRRAAPPQTRVWHSSSARKSGKPKPRHTESDWVQLAAWLDHAAQELAARTLCHDIAPPNMAELKALHDSATRLRQQIAALKQFGV